MANAVKESSKKNSLRPNAASHNNASWHTDTNVFLEHSPSGGSLYYKGPALQKVILVLGGSSPLLCHFNIFFQMTRKQGEFHKLFLLASLSEKIVEIILKINYYS